MTGNMQNRPASQGDIPGHASNAQAPQPVLQSYTGQTGQHQPVQGHPAQSNPQQFQQPYGQHPVGQPERRPFPGTDIPQGQAPQQPKQAVRQEPPAAKPERSAKGKRNIIIAICAAVIIVVIAGALVFANVSGNAFFDSSAQSGQPSYKTPEEIEAERNRQMEEGMLNISIASVIEFENGTSPGTAFIENVPSNKYVLKVTITTDNNGEVVYQSGGIKPDSFIETITLSKPLAAGTYPATATFVAYNPDTLQEVGQANAKVTLVVKQ